jgi:hypothetical protein
MKYCVDCVHADKHTSVWLCDKEYPSLLHPVSIRDLSCYDARHAGYACGVDAQHFELVKEEK